MMVVTVMLVVVLLVMVMSMLVVGAVVRIVLVLENVERKRNRQVEGNSRHGGINSRLCRAVLFLPERDMPQIVERYHSEILD